jgi:4'-phosphopantetheinyl transferase
MPGEHPSDAAQGPAPRAAATGAVRVWLVDPDACSERELAACEAVLDAEERARAGGMRSAAARRSFIVAHALARRSLSRAAPVAPAAWRFAREPGGRPEIAGPTAGAGLRFNLSHTDGLAACAVARGAEVGIDVEAGVRLQRPLALAERFFAPAETAALRALPEPAQRERFLALWAAKEAVLKARGVGLASGLEAVRVSFEGGRAVLDASGEPEPPTGAPGALPVFALALFRPTSRHVLAVALRGAPGSVRAVEVAFEDGRPVPGEGATAG